MTLWVKIKGGNAQIKTNDPAKLSIIFYFHDVSKLFLVR